VLFVEAQKPRGVYMLCAGEVKLSAMARDGRTIIVRIAKPGELLGLHATVSNQPYGYRCTGCAIARRSSVR
jgi:CRP/FNR family transcriptional regulator, cyclic AMP receptor protein